MVFFVGFRARQLCPVQGFIVQGLVHRIITPTRLSLIGVGFAASRNSRAEVSRTPALITLDKKEG